MSKTLLWERHLILITFRVKISQASTMKEVQLIKDLKWSVAKSIETKVRD